MGNMNLMYGSLFCAYRPGTNQVKAGGGEGHLYLSNKLVTEFVKKTSCNINKKNLCT
jgi:hypothetical protein